MQKMEKNMNKVSKPENKEVRKILDKMMNKLIKKDIKFLKELAKY